MLSQDADKVTERLRRWLIPSMNDISTPSTILYILPYILVCMAIVVS